MKRSSEPAWSASAAVTANDAAAEEEKVRGRTRAQIITRLLAMDRQNASVPKGRQYRNGRSQSRNREFSALVKALYDFRCQVCGLLISNVDDSRFFAHVHHFEPWAGDRSDTISNVICVCPNHHAMLELGTLQWNGAELTQWDPSHACWTPVSLSFDRQPEDGSISI